MHELSLAMAMLDLVEDQARRNGVNRVLSVRVEVGDLACVEVDALQFAFQSAREGTVAAEAELQVERVPGRGRCTGCGEEFAVEVLGSPCPACDSPYVEILAGREMRVRDLEVE